MKCGRFENKLAPFNFPVT